MSVQIVQIVQELSTSGGVETVAGELARVFSRNGIANLVLASSVGESIGPETDIERVAPWLSRIPTRGLLRHIGRALVVPAFTIAATNALRRHPGAVVISHGDSLKGDVLIVHAVNAQSLSEKRAAGSWLWLLNPMHAWVSVRDRWMIGGLRYRMFVAVSPRVRSELQDLYSVPASRILVIPNGIDISRFSQDAAAGRRSAASSIFQPKRNYCCSWAMNFDARASLTQSARSSCWERTCGCLWWDLTIRPPTESWRATPALV